jgi:hypothetical protein
MILFGFLILMARLEPKPVQLLQCLIKLTLWQGTQAERLLHYRYLPFLNFAQIFHHGLPLLICPVGVLAVGSQRNIEIETELIEAVKGSLGSVCGCSGYRPSGCVAVLIVFADYFDLAVGHSLLLALIYAAHPSLLFAMVGVLCAVLVFKRSCYRWQAFGLALPVSDFHINPFAVLATFARFSEFFWAASQRQAVLIFPVVVAAISRTSGLAVDLVR